MPPSKLTPPIIAAAITGFEQQKIAINQHLAELRQLLNGGAAETSTIQARAGARRTLSAAARKRIAAAQRARWAKAREEAASPAPEPKPKRKLSAATKARLIANLKKARAAKAAKVNAE